MTKQTGLGDNFYVSGYNLSGDIATIDQIGGGPAALDVTGINKSGRERLGGTRDGRMSFKTHYNTAANQSHARFSTLPSTDVLLTYFRGEVLGGVAASMVAKQLDYAPTRDDNGGITFNVEALANSFGLDYGHQLTAGPRTDTGAAQGTGVDGTAQSTFGLQAYLQVFSFTGTDATVKLQESSDNGSTDAWADVVGGGFTQITSGPTSQRIATASALTVEQYLRVVTVTTGGFSSLVFAVMVARNLTAVSF